MKSVEIFKAVYIALFLILVFFLQVEFENIL